MRLALLSLLNGLSVAALYFIVACGFTLIFGLMRTINLAHGSLFLVGGYVGWQVAETSGWWTFGLLAGCLSAGLAGALLQAALLDRIRGQDLRQALLTIGASIVAVDLLLANFGGLTYQFTPPDWMQESLQVPGVGRYPVFRLLVIACAVVVGVTLATVLARTRLGMAIRAGVDSREMLAALGVNPSYLFLLVASCAGALAGLAGVVGGTALSISPGEDSRYLLASLVVTIVGGMGSLAGTAIGALVVGMLEQIGQLYFPNYSIAAIYAVMVLVLAVQPQGLMGRPA